MKISTKFNIGDKVYTYNSIYNSDGETERFPDNKLYSISGINVMITSDLTQIDYLLADDKLVSEDDLFTSLEKVKEFCKD